jgi:hypothetical protein
VIYRVGYAAGRLTFWLVWLLAVVVAGTASTWWEATLAVALFVLALVWAWRR